MRLAATLYEEHAVVKTKLQRRKKRRREVLFTEVQMAAVEVMEPTDRTDRRISMQVSGASYMYRPTDRSEK